MCLVRLRVGVSSVRAAPPRCQEKVGAMPGPRPPAFIEHFYLSIKIFLFLPSLHKNICCQDADAGPEHPLAGPGRKASVRTPTTPPATTPVKIFAHESKKYLLIKIPPDAAHHAHLADEPRPDAEGCEPGVHLAHVDLQLCQVELETILHEV